MARGAAGVVGPGDTAHAPNYSSAALEALVALGARRNSVVPAGLDSYHVGAESELSALFRRPDGSEGATQIEQMASVLEWHRSGEFSQHIIGYQAQLSGPNVSALDFLKQSWIVPMLYGNRLGLFLGRDTAHTARRAIARDTVVRVVHPFARDRDSVYQFSGGDTTVTIHVQGQSIPIARIHVLVRPHLRRRTLVFEGDIYVDAVNGEIVRMRGSFEAIGGRASLGSMIQGELLQGQVYIDLSNRVVEGSYWLPNSQRIEVGISSPFLGESRSVFRIITHFDAYALNGLGAPGISAPPGAIAGSKADSIVDTLATDTLRVLPHRLTIAPADSLAKFSGWHTQIGDATGAVRLEDFNDVAPDRWRETGPPTLSLGSRSASDFVRFDRVEGLYTGVGLTLRYRDAAPGLISRANVGWAWAEKTVRGGVSTDWVNREWRIGASVARTLDNTNDFRGLFTSGPFLEALVAEDNYDYVDRRAALLTVRHDWWGAAGGHGIALTVNGGVSDDHGEVTRLTRGLLPPVLFTDSIFRPNRNVMQGSYLIGGVTLAIHPSVDAGFVGQGLGARLHYEIAGGQLAWQRAEARAVLRQTWGQFTTLARVDGGFVTGSVIPPQQNVRDRTHRGSAGVQLQAVRGRPGCDLGSSRECTRCRCGERRCELAASCCRAPRHHSAWASRAAGLRRRPLQGVWRWSSSGRASTRRRTRCYAIRPERRSRSRVPPTESERRSMS